MKYNQVNFRHLLPYVEKPARYINHELNACHKTPQPELINFCLAFPDIYEVGISHFGIKILYSILNQQADAMADRVYTPWVDFADLLKKEQIPLFSLESKVALKDFDVIGFTLQTEQNFTNILFMLELAQIPFYSKDRDNTYPLIIGGGINALNPEPLADFFDAILIGEGEEAIIEFKDCLKQFKHLSKNDLLLKIAQIKGFYVPALYHSEYNKLVPCQPEVPATVSIRKFQDFSHSPLTHSPQLVPWNEGTHNRFVAEIMRGCTRGCRFCQAGMFYRPSRERSPELIVKEILEGIQSNGWDEAGLLSLSSSDYTCIKPLLTELFNQLNSAGVSLALPSLRIDSIDDSIVNLLNQIRKTGLTLAPEAGTQRLRDVVNKNISEADIFNAVDFAFSNGFRIIKFYFMVGLPFETEEDIDGIIQLIEKIVLHTNKKMAINVTLSPFVPKPFTPFQWSAMDSQEELLRKVLKIKYSLSKYRMVKSKYHTIENSMMEGIFCKAGRNASALLLRAYQNGAILDGWNEFFKFDIWTQSADEIGFNWQIYNQENALDELLPWDHIDIGIKKEFLIKEYLKAQKLELTEDCRTGSCSDCGACADVKPDFAEWHLEGVPVLQDKIKSTYTESFHYRIYYHKTEYLQFVTHLDFLRMLHRLLLATDLPVCYSQGYNPHPKTSFCPPLAIGIESENDFFDVQLHSPVNPLKVLEKLNSFNIKGLKFHFCLCSLEHVKSKKKQFLQLNDKLAVSDLSHYLCADYQDNLSQVMSDISLYNDEIIEIEMPENLLTKIPDINAERIKRLIEQFNNSLTVIYEKEKKGKMKQFDLKELVRQIDFDQNCLIIHKKIIGLNIFDIMQCLFNISRNEAGAFRIVRKKIFV